MNVGEVPGYVEFEFDLPGALLARLVKTFDKIGSVQLSEEAVKNIPDEQGVYQLLLTNGPSSEIVYIGKTDSAAGLCKRLSRHARKIQHRLNLDLNQIQFKAVRVFVFTAVDLEAQMIEHYALSMQSWQGSGFGSNDPGVKRDTTTYKPTHFDWRYPIDVDRDITFDIPREDTVAVLLRALKRNLPYLIRFECAGNKSRAPHVDLSKTKVALDPSLPLTPKNVLIQLVEPLPKGWHATVLPSHVIVYKNDTRNFPSGKLLVKSNGPLG